MYFDTGTGQLVCDGEWNVAHFSQLRKQFKKITLPTQGIVIIDGSNISSMDSAGAWLLSDWVKKIEKNGAHVQLKNFSEQQQKLLSLIKQRTATPSDLPKVRSLSWLARLGKMVIEQTAGLISYFSFIGQIATEYFAIVIHPARWRISAILSVIEKSGYQALPIIALLSFMIGVVIAYQMGLQLRQYGANVFIVNLLGLSVLREFGPLLTAIIIAGRTGSAFTAQLGTMKVNQEIDALNTMGVTPTELLLLPRITGLFISLPLLTIWADMFGVLGGMVMANNMLNITWYEFMQRFEHEIPLRALLIGLGKAPVFALIIASVGCFQGLQVQGSADSVGKKTTRSVVFAIFFIIVTDALFSVIFSKFKL